MFSALSPEFSAAVRTVISFIPLAVHFMHVMHTVRQIYAGH